jgi:hypothetical protein
MNNRDTRPIECSTERKKHKTRPVEPSRHEHEAPTTHHPHSYSRSSHESSKHAKKNHTLRTITNHPSIRTCRATAHQTHTIDPRSSLIDLHRSSPLPSALASQPWRLAQCFMWRSSPPSSWCLSSARQRWRRSWGR